MDVISRNAAKAAGLKYYFTGELCDEGHTDLRFVSSYQCRACSYQRVLDIYHSKRQPLNGRTCSVCNSELSANKNRKARYCSDECRRKSRGRKYKESESRYKRANRARINARIFHRYHADQAWRDSFLQRNKESVARRFARDPEHMRAVDRRNASKRRAIQKQVFVEVVDPRVVFERDKGICGICLKAVESKSKWEVDHIIPLSKQGPHSYANVQLSHPECNRRKWAHLPTATI